MDWKARPFCGGARSLSGVQAIDQRIEQAKQVIGALVRSLLSSPNARCKQKGPEPLLEHPLIVASRKGDWPFLTILALDCDVRVNQGGIGKGDQGAGQQTECVRMEDRAGESKN